VRPNLISCYLPVRQYREKTVDNVVGECSAIVWKGCRAAMVVGKNVWQQPSRNVDCALRRIAARVFQFVREDANEAIIIHWLAVEVRLSLLSGQKDGLQGSPTAVCLYPAFVSLVQCASPKSHPIRAES